MISAQTTPKRGAGKTRAWRSMTKALITDLYQLTMGAAYQLNDKTSVSTFDLFIRKLPKGWGYLVAAGLEDVIRYIEDLRFTDQDIQHLDSLNILPKSYLDSLKDFRFTGDISAVPEGTVIFPNEPIIRVTAPKIQAQFIETYLLNKINFQTLIASKASRIIHAAGSAPVMEFGLRRAHDESAALNGARSSYIAGFAATSNVEAGRLFGIPIAGTHAHSFVMSFDSELEAFRAYAKAFPDNCTLLIDTYDPIQGAKNALIIAKELESQGHRLKAVRLDSGDLAADSKAVRSILDQGDAKYVKIVASNDLNEHRIAALRAAEAPIDSYGVGTENITSRDCPALPGVYKLAEDIDKSGNPIGRIKLSKDKATLPGKKQVFRLYRDGKFVEDVIGLDGEDVSAAPLLVQIFSQGKLVYRLPSLDQIRDYARSQFNALPTTVASIDTPAKYDVRTSPSLDRLLIETKNRMEGYL